ncbi:VOC family protein [Natronoglycomyces albus]|uniref:VOC family protein n=1 Tax=Natronoglycomyces albus TaxID=2811108 RepID=A0A895XLE9_9ACTN|nr:VOC family protein [Natronoglycomyces albus]QSB04622.1 VOC family protein [Natronoglycomyces albus]
MKHYPSPVPDPGPNAVAPDIYRELYLMPMFVIIPSVDIEQSKDFWCRGLGFGDLFSAPQLTHLRRWAFQDVLLVPADQVEETPSSTVSFACVHNQLDQIATRCEELVPGCTSGPDEKPWNAVELTVTTPEGARVVMTAALPLPTAGPQAENLLDLGIDLPGT